MIRAKYQIPALFFILAAATVATAFLLSHAEPAMDLYLHDTYYVISHTFIFSVLSLYFVACAAIYLIYGKVVRNPTSLRLGHVHFWLSTLSVAILAYALHKTHSFGTDVARAQAVMHSLAELSLAAFFGFFVAQIGFVVNVVWSFFRR
ncbi:MAG TPA: cbb3-type cytochrome c oxidase subunit I [Candidatus Acidoferrales bacterium]|nr:cbb3-type cytochrome c oxidase subunit I [Candidatus Acidoferrales bacterium]